MLILLTVALLVTALGASAGLHALKGRIDEQDAAIRQLEQAERER